jgi:transposase
MAKIRAYVGLDVHKATIAVSIAEAGASGEVRFLGNYANTPDQVKKLVAAIVKRHRCVEFTYEAGPCGYGIYRQILSLGQACQVIAPSHILRRPGDKTKNDHRDSMTLARLARAGELTRVWVPDEVHEAARDLVRARHAANRDLRHARQRIQSYLLKTGRLYERKPWTGRHLTWLANLKFLHAAQQIAFQNYVNAMEQALTRRTQMEQQLNSLIASWTLSPLVIALQAMRGVAMIIAATVAAEVGDMTRFSNPRQLMAYLGLTPGEFSSGTKTRPRGITKAGNSTVRSLLYEAAWNYRQTPKVGAYMLAHMPKDIPQAAKDIAWKAQLRLCKRYHKLIAGGKKSQVAITAVARELLGFMWAIARAVGPPNIQQAA